MSTYLVIGLLCAALGLWGCGDDDGGTATGPEQTQGAEVDVTARTYAGRNVTLIKAGEWAEFA